VDKRFVQFMLITVLIWTTYVALRLAFLPEQVPPVVEQQDPQAENPVDPKQEKKTDPAPPEDPTQPPRVTNPTDDEKPAKPAAKRQRLTLGSLDKSSPYKMLVTFDSLGAALERVELVHYRDMEKLHGYLGSLDLVATQGGCRIEVVGPGTPAATAKSTDGGTVGLKAGDILTAIDKEEITEPMQLEKYLEKTHPGDTVALKILRTESGKSQNVEFTAVLTGLPLVLIQPEVHTWSEEVESDPASLLFSLDTIGAKQLKPGEAEFKGLPSLRNSTWELDSQGTDFVQFKVVLPAPKGTEFGPVGDLEIVKRFELKPAAAATDKQQYHLSLSLNVRNKGEQPVRLGYRLDGPNGLPLEGWWYFVKLHPGFMKGAGARDVVYRFAGKAHEMMGSPAIRSETLTEMTKKAPQEIILLHDNQPASLDYIGVDTQFFAASLQPKVAEGQETPKFRRVVAQALHNPKLIPKYRERMLNTSFSLSSVPTELAAGDELKQEFTVFLGPKEPEILDQYQLRSFIELGWAYAKYPALLMAGILDFLYRFICSNYGIAIILLTVVVRCCMLPFSLKQTKAAAKMQSKMAIIQPELMKIKEKYKDDLEKQMKATNELYAKHDFHPMDQMGGCLLMFFQLPVFVGLYRCLSVDIHLRDAALFPGLSWASNLAGPDRLFDWNVHPWITDEGMGYLGPFFNVLPLITVTLFLIQQKLFAPPPTDEQQEMQQKMMTYMTVFMGVMFYKVPAGLCVYIITTSLWSIAERKLLPKPTTADSASPPPPKPVKADPPRLSSNGKKKRK
jgi:YidC/Oxa1 family membrane protein insertase